MAGLCVLNSERTPKKWIYPPIIYQADKSNNNHLEARANLEKMINSHAEHDEVIKWIIKITMTKN